MSSILKALRKLEEERASRREGGLDIARDILRLPPSRRRRSPWGPMIALAGLLLLGAGAWGVFHHLAPVPLLQMPGQEVLSLSLQATESAPPAAETPAAPLVNRLAGVRAEPEIIEEMMDDPPAVRVGEKASSRPAVPPSRPAPLPSRPAVSPAAMAKRPPAAVVAPSSAAPTRSAEPLATPVVSSPQLVPAQPEAVSLPSPAEKSGATQAPGAAPPVTPLAEMVRPTLVVSGIAFNDDPDARLAVVNDLPVMRGTSVEGVMVEEIFPDRVRFSLGGKSFEIKMED